MAIYSNGILGEFRGKVGSVVGSSWKGIPVIRKIPDRKETEYSDLQKQQWARFKLMTGFLRPLTDLFNQTYKNSAAGMTCYNKAYSENSQAITGDYPAISIDYSKIVLSKGRLPLGEPPIISSPEEGKLLLTWKTGDGINGHLTNGIAFIATYNEELSRWIVGQYAISESQSSCMLDVSPFTGKSAQTYIGFISKGCKKVSESRYMGTVNIL
jgi:Family of unknown function (DUF6266)